MGAGWMVLGKLRREGKVRPVPGNSPHDRRVSRGFCFTLWRVCDDPFRATACCYQLRKMPKPPACVFQPWRNLSAPMQFPRQARNQTPGWDRTASRWSAPNPGSRTRREERAPSHRPQMSSGRLWLDRVARQQCPSPVHRQTQLNMRSSHRQAKGDILTLPARGHFYFALTQGRGAVDTDYFGV